MKRFEACAWYAGYLQKCCRQTYGASLAATGSGRSHHQCLLLDADRRLSAEAQQQQQVAQQKAEAEAEAMAKQKLQLEIEAQAANVEKTRSNTELNKAKVIQLGHGMATDTIDQGHSIQQGQDHNAIASLQAGIDAAQTAAKATQDAADAADRRIVDTQNQIIADSIDEARYPAPTRDTT